MSSISGRALKRLQRSFGDLCLCKSVLVIPPTGHIVRGFVFEHTPYKGLFYFWRIVFPLYTDWPTIMLNFGDRAGGNYFDLSDTEFERSIARLVDYISAELEDLRSIHDPETFLVRFGGPSIEQGYAMRLGAFDAAMTYYLMGKIEFCLNALEYLAGANLAPGGMDRLASWRGLLRDMRTDPSACGRYIAQLEAKNIRRFALEPTILRGQATEQAPLAL